MKLTIVTYNHQNIFKYRPLVNFKSVAHRPRKVTHFNEDKVMGSRPAPAPAPAPAPGIRGKKMSKIMKVLWLSHYVVMSMVKM
jgi:hypothetical protein